MPAEPGIQVLGLRELSQAFNKLGGDVRKEFRASERAIAEPVARDTEQFALSRIRRMPRSPAWAKTRIGVTGGEVYIVPKERGVKGRGRDPRRRGKKFANLMMTRVYDPALERNRRNVERNVEQLLDRVTREFNTSGGL